MVRRSKEIEGRRAKAEMPTVVEVLLVAREQAEGVRQLIAESRRHRCPTEEQLRKAKATLEQAQRLIGRPHK